MLEQKNAERSRNSVNLAIWTKALPVPKMYGDCFLSYGDDIQIAVLRIQLELLGFPGLYVNV